MEINKFQTLADFSAYLTAVLPRRYSVEMLMGAEHKHDSSWNLIGFCRPCEKASRFLVDWQYSDKTIPNFRERCVCEHCGLNNRQRFMLSYLADCLKHDSNVSDIFAYEQVTAFYRFLTTKLQDINVVGSEYLGFDKIGGDVFDGIRHEDAVDLSFVDHSFDFIVSNDVFEHVPDILKAFAEAFRVLKPQGKLLFTIPFYYNSEVTQQRAKFNTGKLECLLPEQYHGNPVSEKGSLVFYDFGWDILETCKAAGFNDAYLLSYYSLFYGHIGGLQMMFVAEK
ncbi:MAG: class I SAM-dependent methyltransferase [Dissulfurispiraceae bacterium]|jgi:SAM-dependent methyltransferase